MYLNIVFLYLIKQLVKDFIIVINDFFDNFLDRIPFFYELMKDYEGKSLLLFNYPGKKFCNM